MLPWDEMPDHSPSKRSGAAGSSPAGVARLSDHRELKARQDALGRSDPASPHPGARTPKSTVRPELCLDGRLLGKRQLVAAQAARVAILGCQFHGSSSLSRLIG